MSEVLQFRPRVEMGKVLPFRRNADATAIGCIPAGARIVSVTDGQRSQTAQSITGNGVTIFYEPERDDAAVFAMDDDTAPCELNPDPFVVDMMDHKDD